MSKAKYIAGAGIVAAGAALSSLPPQGQVQAEPLDSTRHEIIISDAPSHEQIVALNAEKKISPRTAQKVYHRFEEIPSISDEEASAYNRNDYIYIVNAEEYQKTGKIELKRVLKDEVTKANTLSLVYRSECQTYNPKPTEDQLAKYVIDLRIMSKTGITKGPSQMDDNAITSFIKYLAANPQTRQYALPLIKTTKGSVEEAAQKLEQKFFDENGDLRPMDERDAILHGDVYKSIYLNDNAWKTVASAKLKRFITATEAEKARKVGRPVHLSNTTKKARKVGRPVHLSNTTKKARKVGRPVHLSNTTKNYLCLTELFPSEELLIQQIEYYNLAFYQLGRPGKTKHVTAALARSMNLKDKSGNLDATRLPPFAIAAAISSINWKGNGRQALRTAQGLRSELAHSSNPNQILRERVKTWVTGKSRRYGVDEMYELNILTPDIIRQYTELELSGAKNLAHNYQKAVEMAESKARIAQHKQTQQADSHVIQQTKQDKDKGQESLLHKGRTLLLTAADFIQGKGRN